MEVRILKEGNSTMKPVDRDNLLTKHGEHVRSVMQGLRVVFGSIQAHSHWIEQQCGVSAIQLWALRELRDAPGMRVTELALVLSVHPSNCSSMVDKLRKKGLVRKQRIGPDQRVVKLFITPEGTELLLKAPNPAQGALIDALEKMPEDKLEELQLVLAELVQGMKIKDHAAASRPMTNT